MRQIATITKGDKTVVEDFEIDVDVDVDEFGIKSWSGNFVAPVDWSITFLNNQFRLKLSDGREGEFFIKRMCVDSGGDCIVTFRGTGPLR